MKTIGDIWVTVPVSDVRIQMPNSMTDRDVKILFKDVETIDSVIAQLESIKEMIDDSVKLFK